MSTFLPKHLNLVSSQNSVLTNQTTSFSQIYRTYVTLKTNNTDKTDLVIASEDASEFTQAVDKLMKPDNRSFA